MSSNDILEKWMVEEAVKKDKGNEVKLISWEIRNFLEVGNNLATNVTSINVVFMKNEQQKEEEEESYIVKLNPCHYLSGMQLIANDLFIHETMFYTKLAPLINSKAKSNQQISVPTCFYSSLNQNKEVLICNDLRNLGYQMHDRKIGLDYSHTSLVMKELAKLHAVGSVLLREDPEFISKFPDLKKDLLVLNSGANADGQKSVADIFQKQLDFPLDLIKCYPEFDNVGPWIKHLQSNMLKAMSDNLSSYTDTFKVIAHGDCWNNNILFKYNSESEVENAMFVDLQICRVTSLACDLNQFLYTSLDGIVRSRHLNDFLQIYYHQFSEVFKEQGHNMPFTFEELLAEYNAKKVYGFCYGLAFGISVVLDGTDIKIYFNVNQELSEEEWKIESQRIVEVLKKNPNFDARFFGVMNDLKRYLAEPKE